MINIRYKQIVIIPSQLMDVIETSGTWPLTNNKILIQVEHLFFTTLK